jgi:hypothetical protein
MPYRDADVMDFIADVCGGSICGVLIAKLFYIEKFNS